MQMATKIAIEPVFEADFRDCSYGFRPKRSAKQALEKVRKACNNKGYYVVDADIEKFFDNVNQDKLMVLVEQRKLTLDNDTFENTGKSRFFERRTSRVLY